jgi:Spy/CpxP family protein refolding chaperone
MKKSIYFCTMIACGAALSVASTSNAQRAPAYGQQPSSLGKAEAIAQQLDLTPQQKLKILPILRDEAPKVQAIKNDNSLSRMQKVQQLRAIHQQTDPQMKAILSKEQYEKLQGIRRQEIKDATQALGK